MAGLPGVSQHDAIRALEKAGFRIIRQGKHVVMSDGDRVGISSQPVFIEAGGETQRDLISVGVGTAAGAVIGAITGNTTRGAAIGAAGGGTAALLHKGDPVVLPPGSALRLTLQDEVRVAVKKIRS